MILYASITMLALLPLLYPFFFTKDKVLVSCYSVNDLQELQHMREEILQLYLRDEKAWSQGDISAKVWQKRQAFWQNRYLDVCRRQDYLALSR